MTKRTKTKAIRLAQAEATDMKVVKVITVKDSVGHALFWQGNVELDIEGNVAKVYENGKLVGAFSNFAGAIITFKTE